jgi:hypothetical protein
MVNIIRQNMADYRLKVVLAASFINTCLLQLIILTDS